MEIDPVFQRQLPRLAAVSLSLVAAALTACGKAEVTAAAAQQIDVVVSPPSATVPPGAQQPFSAAVTGTASAAVTWSIQEGATAGSITAAGVYTAPATPGTYHVVATSVADTGSAGVAMVTVPAPVSVVVTLTPATATVTAGTSRTFTAAVTGSTDTAVTWSVQEASGCGSVTQAGVYTAPPVAATTTCHVAATSHADPTKVAAATVTVTPAAPVSVSISPAAGTVNECQSLAFTATVTGSANTAVTWSLQEGATAGGISTAGVYTAAGAGTYHVVATSAADPTRSASVPVTVTARVLSVTVSPATVSVAPGGTSQLTATVTTTCGSFASVKTVDASGRVVSD